MKWDTDQKIGVGHRRLHAITKNYYYLKISRLADFASRLTARLYLLSCLKNERILVQAHSAATKFFAVYMDQNESGLSLGVCWHHEYYQSYQFLELFVLHRTVMSPSCELLAITFYPRNFWEILEKSFKTKIDFNEMNILELAKSLAISQSSINMSSCHAFT